MVFDDDTEPTFNERRFKICDWSEYYPDAKEVLPANMPASGEGTGRRGVLLRRC